MPTDTPAPPVLQKKLNQQPPVKPEAVAKVVPLLQPLSSLLRFPVIDQEISVRRQLPPCRMLAPLCLLNQRTAMNFGQLAVCRGNAVHLAHQLFPPIGLAMMAIASP